MEKTLAALAAAAAIAAAAAVSVVAASFALYAVLEPRVGAAGAAAILAGVAALLALILGLVVARKAEGKHHDRGPEAHDVGLIGKVMDLAKEKPMLAAGVAVAAGIFALRNPAVLTAVISAFVAGGNTTPPKR